MLTFRRGGPRPGFNPVLGFSLALTLLHAPLPAHAGGGPVGPPILGISWTTVPLVPCDGDDVRLRFSVCECAVDLQAAALDSTSGLVQVWLRAEPDRTCITCRPDSAEVSLGRRSAGFHTQKVRILIDYASAPADSSWPPSPADGELAFEVSRGCSTGTGVAYLDEVRIGEQVGCRACPPVACPNDSIDVLLAGSFPDGCTWLRAIQLFDQPYGSPLPGVPVPPIVRVLYGGTTCGPCTQEPGSWDARLKLPGLPHLSNVSYQLHVEGYLQDECAPGDSLGSSVGRALFPFSVAESCSTQVPGACYKVAWTTPPDLPIDQRRIGCLALYSGSEPARLEFNIGSHTAIAGVQGRFVLDAGGALVARNVVPLVPGWQVVQTPGANGGVDFIAFASSPAAVLPPTLYGVPVRLLGLEVAANSDSLPGRVYLEAADLLVSDPAGELLPPCPIFFEIYPPPHVAVLCQGNQACDANRDGATDVRDLVRMIQCLNPLADVRLACPGYDVVDCDRDADFDFDDVFCCARVMLGGFGGGPGDSLRRDAPEIAVGFGLPRPAADGALEVPIRFVGLTDVSAARVDVTYPDTRYSIENVAFTDAPPGWWTATHVAGGRVGFAMVALGVSTEAVSVGRAEAVLRLRLRSGASAGGELAVVKHDFAASDGVALVTPNADASVALGATGSVALSTPHPNPFGAVTAFSLTLPIEGAVDVAVFNSAGRRMATLLRGDHVAAGVHALSWNGVDAGGLRVAGGVYFVRVVAADGQTARKVLFLPGSAR